MPKVNKVADWLPGDLRLSATTRRCLRQPLILFCPSNRASERLSKTALLCSEYFMLHKIELRYFYGWDDAGWTEEIDKETKPMRFATAREAQVELDRFFADVKAAVVAGDMDSEEVHDDYRIVAVNDAE